MVRIWIKIIPIVAFLIQAGNSNCQNLHYTENYYTSHPFLINPAMAGAPMGFTISAGYNKQFVGIKNAPGSLIVTGVFRNGNQDFYDSKMHLNKTRNKFSSRFGFGAMLYNNTNGPVNETSGLLTYAYHIKINQNTLAFGISSVLSNAWYNYKNTHPDNADDPLLQVDSESKFSLDADFGALIYGKKWYAGLSILELFQSDYFINSVEKNYQDCYLEAGYKLYISNQLSFEPSVVLKLVNYHSMLADFHFSLSYRTVANIGISYCMKNFIGYNLTFLLYKNLYLGYTYEQNLNDFATYASGNHLINLYYKPCK